MQLGSMFISNCNNTLHVSDAFCLHPQEHLKTVVTASGVWHETGWSIQYGRPRSMTSALSHIVYRTGWLVVRVDRLTASQPVLYIIWLSAEAIDLGRPYWILHPVSCHTPEAVTTVFKCSWGWRQKASETCRVLLQLLTNILPSCITLVFYIYKQLIYSYWSNAVTMCVGYVSRVT